MTMALPPEVGDREVQKFVETDAGDVAVRTMDASGNTLDAGNSTTDDLPVNQQFKGTWLDVTGFSSAQVSLKTQNKGTLYLEWSSVNTATGNFDSEFTEQFDNPGKREFLIRKNHRARYFRTRYLNNGFAQTAMVLSTFHGVFNAPHDAVRLTGKGNSDLVSVLKKDGTITIQARDRELFNLLHGIMEQLTIQTELLKAILE
jgi:hypothetical protein